MLRWTPPTHLSWHLHTNTNSQKFPSPFTGLKNGVSRAVAGTNDDDDGCYIQVSKKPSSAVELPTLSASSGAAQAKTERARSNTSQAKLQAKKRVIRMLMVIVALFFVCWMPLYTVNTWKAFDLRSAHQALSGAPISFIHLLSYTSACVNPIIYCFMNTRFRMALLATFACCCATRLCRCCWWCRKREGGEDGITATSMATSMSKFSYTTVSTAGTWVWWRGSSSWAKAVTASAAVTAHLMFQLVFFTAHLMCWIIFPSPFMEPFLNVLFQFCVHGCRGKMSFILLTFVSTVWLAASALSHTEENIKCLCSLCGFVCHDSLIIHWNRHFGKENMLDKVNLLYM